MDIENRVVKNVNKKLETETFINNHKSNPKDFTRTRALNFITVFMLILKKSIKSLQLTLNELFMQGSISALVTASAYTQARKKFKHTAFIELNNDTVGIYYDGNKKVKRWNRFRCIGGDASVIILPKNKEIQEEFGEKRIRNQLMEDKYSSVMFLCFYDVLNNIAVKSELAAYSSYEVDIATKMLDDSIKSDDLLIFDRCYASYEFLATLTMRKKNYLIRCQSNSFNIVRSLYKKRKATSKVVTLSAAPKHVNSLKEKGLPTVVKVRFISVVLSTGETEVLVTSLVDEDISCEDFKKLYNLRWGIESFFYLLKSRLNLENFTGKTVESVRQDFWSTIFICNIESILTERVELELNDNHKDTQPTKKVNHAVSFNAIKHMVFEIFFNMKGNTSDTLDKLKTLFKTGIIVQRKDRSPPRKEMNFRTAYYYAKRIKKHVF